MTTYPMVRGKRDLELMTARRVGDLRGAHALRHVRKPDRVLRAHGARRYLGGHLK